jgi:hypothetical protein
VTGKRRMNLIAKLCSMLRRINAVASEPPPDLF